METDAEVAPQRIATLAELTGPWREAPLLLDPMLRLEVETVCRRDIEMGDVGTAVLVDVRGAGVATVRMSGAKTGSCSVLAITGRNRVESAGGGWRADGPERVGPPLPGKLGELEPDDIDGGDVIDVNGASVYGRAGAGIATVVVQPQDRPAVLATLENGWFGAWWPTPPRPDQRLLDGPHLPQPFVVRAYDATGALLDERVFEGR